MPAIIPFIPMIASGVSAVVGGIAGKRAQNKAKKEGVVRSPEEAAAISGLSGQANRLAGQGNQMMGQGQRLLQGPANYYQTLMSGDRAATANAIAPQMAQITDVYRGAERNVDRVGMRGAVRDQQMGELGRERASKLAGLVTGVQPGAATALTGLGNQFMQSGTGLASNAGNLYAQYMTGMRGEGVQQRNYENQQGEQAAKVWGGLAGDLINAGGDIYKGTSKAPLSNKQNTAWGGTYDPTIYKPPVPVQHTPTVDPTNFFESSRVRGGGWGG